jgi:nicotinate-nucleotide--dimethylbenzimidazole phosphoribosyltransferase
VDDLELSLWREGITTPDAAARAAAAGRQDILTKPAGALGRLEEVSIWLAGVTGRCPPPPVRHPALAIFAGDHGVARTAGTSAYPPEVTAQMVANFASGGAGATVLARSRGAEVRIVDVSVDIDWPGSGLPVPDAVVADRIRRGSGSIDREDAMTPEQSAAAIRLGARVADELIDGGADLLIAGDMGIGNTTPAAVLVGLLADVEPAAVVGRGTGIDDTTWMRKTAAVRDAMRRGRPHKGDPVALLATVAGPDLAAITGFLLQAAMRRTPVLLDGVVSCACALVAHRVAFRSVQWWLASHRSTEPAASAALGRLGLEPLIDLGMRLGEGSGALVALPLVTAAGDLLREMATFESAGVSDRAASADELTGPDEPGPDEPGPGEPEPDAPEPDEPAGGAVAGPTAP